MLKLDKITNNNLYNKNIEIQSIAKEKLRPIDSTIFYYRLDCLGGVPLVVALYDLFGVDGIRQYQTIKINHCLHVNSGIYPLNVDMIEIFCQNYINTLKQCDYIGCWDRGYLPEMYLVQKYGKEKTIVQNGNHPWFNSNNWYEKLHGKKILIISSHSKSMEFQWYSDNVFKSHGKKISHSDTSIDLEFVIPPTSLCGNTPHESWVHGLQELKNNVDKKVNDFNFDIALISCGGYASSISSHIYNEYNKSTFYIGGGLQLYFSIKGRRWIDKVKVNMNEYWKSVYPEEIPENYQRVENGCYF